jgi:hypothetical protein
MIENYRSSDYDKFEFMADTFFRAGFGSVQFRGSQSNMLLSVLMTEFDKASIISILHNGFDRCRNPDSLNNQTEQDIVSRRYMGQDRATDRKLETSAKTYGNWRSCLNDARSQG